MPTVVIPGSIKIFNYLWKLQKINWDNSGVLPAAKAAALLWMGWLIGKGTSAINDEKYKPILLRMELHITSLNRHFRAWWGWYYMLGRGKRGALWKYVIFPLGLKANRKAEGQGNYQPCPLKRFQSLPCWTPILEHWSLFTDNQCFRNPRQIWRGLNRPRHYLHRNRPHTSPP